MEYVDYGQLLPNCLCIAVEMSLKHACAVYSGLEIHFFFFYNISKEA